VLGGGDVLGEMALLTGAPRTATARTGTSVTLAQIDQEAFAELMSTVPGIRDRIWDRYAIHALDNLLRGRRDFGHLSRRERIEWVKGRPHCVLEAGDEVQTGEARFVFVCVGAVDLDGETHQAPALLDLVKSGPLRAVTGARLVLLP
jgi:hypothetical protein